MASHLTCIASFLSLLVIAHPQVAATDVPSPPPRLIGIEFNALNIEGAADAIAVATGRIIAVAPELNSARVSFATSEPVTPEELYRQFIVALRHYGYRTLEVEDVATIVPDPIVIPTPGSGRLTIDFDRVTLTIAAADIGRFSGRVIAVALGAPLSDVSFSVTDPATPDEVYRQFVAMIEQLGYQVVEAERIVTLVPPMMRERRQAEQKARADRHELP